MSPSAENKPRINVSVSYPEGVMKKRKRERSGGERKKEKKKEGGRKKQSLYS